MSAIEVVLNDDEFGTDLLIDGMHNVNLGWSPESLSEATHVTRDGKRMEVLFHATLRTYYVIAE